MNTPLDHIHNEYCTTCDKDNSAKILRQKLRMKMSHMRTGRLPKATQEYRMEMIEQKIDKKKQAPIFRNPSEMPPENAMEEDVSPHPDAMVEDVSETNTIKNNK